MTKPLPPDQRKGVFGEGGQRFGAGRKKGTVNRITAREREKHLGEGLNTPLDVMVEAMRFRYRLYEAEKAKGGAADVDKMKEEIEAASDQAAKCASYLHPKLAAVTHTGPNNGPIQTLDVSKLTDEQLTALEPVLAALAGAGADVAGGAGGTGAA